MVRNYVRRDVGQLESQINSQKLVYKQVMSIPVLMQLQNFVLSQMEQCLNYYLFKSSQNLAAKIGKVAVFQRQSVKYTVSELWD